MDPVTAIVTALAVGAAAGLKDDATQGVKDAYAGLKALISRKYQSARGSVARLEEKPDLPGRKASVAEDLVAAGAQDDEELAQCAAAVVALVRSKDPDAARTIGVDLKDVDAAAITLRNVRASGRGATGIRGHGIRTAGDITIEGVTAEESPKKA